MRFDIALLAEKLGIPVVGAAIGRKRGLAELRQPSPVTGRGGRPLPMPPIWNATSSVLPR